MSVLSKSELIQLYRRVSFSQKLHAIIRINRFPFAQIDSLVPKSGKILDLGCGHGFLAVYLGASSFRRSVVGTDISKSKIDIAKKIQSPKNIEFLHDFTNSAIKKKDYYDCVLAISVLYLMSEGMQKEILKKIAVSLKKGGRLILVEPNAEHAIGIMGEKIREFIMVNILRATKGESIVYHKESWWRKELGRSFSRIETSNFRESNLHLVYMCVK